MKFAKFIVIIIAIMTWLSWVGVVERDSAIGRQAFLSSTYMTPLTAPPPGFNETVSDYIYYIIPIYMSEGNFSISIYSPPCISVNTVIIRLGDNISIGSLSLGNGEKVSLDMYAPTPGVYGVILEVKLIESSCPLKVPGSLSVFQARVPEERLRALLILLAVPLSIISILLFIVKPRHIVFPKDYKFKRGLATSYYTVDPIIASILGLLGGLLCYFIGSNIQPYFRQATNIPGIYSHDLMDIWRASHSLYLSEGGWRVIKLSFYEGLLSAYLSLVPMSSLLASYTLAMEREQGFSLLSQLLGVNRSKYLVLRVVMPWILYVVIAGVSGIIGVTLLEPFLIIKSLAAIAYVALAASVLAGSQLLFSYIIASISRSAYRGLILSISTLYIFYIIGVHEYMIKAPDAPMITSNSPNMIMDDMPLLGLEKSHFTILGVEMLILALAMASFYLVLLRRYPLR